MNEKVHCEELFNFHLWRQQRIIELLKTLDTEYFSKQLSGSFGSLFIVLKHLVWAEKVWLGRVNNNEVATMRDQNVEGMLADWQGVTQKWISLIEKTDDTDFESSVRYFTSKGEEYHNSLFEIVIHLIDHSTYHIGQMMNAIRAFGMEPVSTNYIHYLRSKKSE